MEHAALRCYDLDYTGGLMEKIQELIAPPISIEDAKEEKRRRAAEREMWRKRCNHETCDACGEGGDLLCCDCCPAAFHLQCANPPLDEDEVPAGEWVCHQCVVTGNFKSTDGKHKHTLTKKALQIFQKHRQELGDRVNAFEKKNVVEEDLLQVKPLQSGMKPIVVNNEFVERSVGLFNRNPPSPLAKRQLSSPDLSPEVVKQLEHRRASDQDGASTGKNWRKSVIKATTRGQKAILEVAPEISPNENPLENPFSMLIAAACLDNTSLFNLPNQYRLHTTLPGTKKRKANERGPGRPKKCLELDGNGLVRLPPKLCFVCTKSCRTFPLIQCDFCSLVFHLDCLDPPLTNPPSGRWMCPSHPERKLLNPYGRTLSQRSKILDMFSSKVPHNDVKINFLKKCHSTYPPKPKYSSRRPSMTVPRSIKDHYHHPIPPPAPAPMEDLLHYNVPLPHSMRIRQRLLRDAKSPSSFSTNSPCTTEEQDLWLKSLITLQSDIVLKTETEKLKSLLETTQSSTARQPSSVKFTPKSLKELSKHAYAAEQYRLLQADSDSFSEELSNDFMSEKIALRNRVASNDDVRPASLQRLTKQSKRRNSDPQSNAFSHQAGTASAKRSRMADAIKVYRPVVLPTRNIPFTKLELPSKEAAMQLRRTLSSEKLPNGDIEPYSGKFSTKNIKSIVSSAANEKLEKKIHQNSFIPPNSAEMSTEVIKPHGLVPECSPTVNGLSECSSFDSDEDLTAGDGNTGSTRNLLPATSIQIDVIPIDQSEASNARSPEQDGVTTESSSRDQEQLRELYEKFAKKISSKDDQILTTIDQKLIQALAIQRLQELLSVKAGSNPVMTPFHSTPPVLAVEKNLKPELDIGMSSDSKPTDECPTSASLAPASQQKRASVASVALYNLKTKEQTNMCRSTSFVIGASGACDLVIQNCNRIKPVHARIFYDKTSNQYEMMSYGEVIVDGVKYGVDLWKLAKIRKKRRREPNLKSASVTRGIKKILQKNNVSSDPNDAAEKIPMASDDHQCTCDKSSDETNLVAGWEGSAMMRHGSVIGFGCVDFVFCMSEFASRPKRRKLNEDLHSTEPKMWQKTAEVLKRIRRTSELKQESIDAYQFDESDEPLKNVLGRPRRTNRKNKHDLKRSHKAKRALTASKPVKSSLKSTLIKISPKKNKDRHKLSKYSNRLQRLLKVAQTKSKKSKELTADSRRILKHSKQPLIQKDLRRNYTSSRKEERHRTAKEINSEVSSDVEEDAKPRRYSKRQVERKARRMRQKDEESEADGGVDAQDDSRSRSRTPLRSCSPAATKTVIEAAMARKNNVNDTSRSFSKNSRALQKHKSKGQNSPRRAPPVEKVPPKENKSSSRSTGSSNRRKDQLSDSCLDFGMADLSENQKKSLGEDDGIPTDEHSSKTSVRNPSLDLTCSETMSLDIETLSASPDSIKDAPLFPSSDSPSPSRCEKIEDEVQSTTEALLDQMEEEKNQIFSQDSKETVAEVENSLPGSQSLEEDAMETVTSADLVVSGTNEPVFISADKDSEVSPEMVCSPPEMTCEDAGTVSTTDKRMGETDKRNIENAGDHRQREDAEEVLESIIMDVEKRITNDIS